MVASDVSTENILLGYDLREEWRPFGSTWDAERRQRFLLRQDISKPLSVDSYVWPSLFDVLLGLQRPDWTGYVQDLWDNLEELGRSAESVAYRTLNQARYIAVELVAASCSEGELADWRDRVREVVPSRIEQPSYRLVGYDVADYYLLSGLMNCEPAQRYDPLRWAPLLNEHHLFREPNSAFDFKLLADKSVREHAPFFVFALWCGPKGLTPQELSSR